MLPALLVNKGCCSYPSPTASPTVSPEGIQNGDKRTARDSVTAAAPNVHPEGTLAGTEQDAGP